MPVGSVDRRCRYGWAWLAVGIALLAIGLTIWREPIGRRLLPDSRLDRQIELAEAALAGGELSRPDGRGARELFEAVLAVDPEHLAAHEGLVHVREAAVARVAGALKTGQASQARQALILAEELAAPIVQLQPLRSRLRDLESSAQVIPELLAQAARADLPDREALAIYERVLGLEADNAFALEGRRALLSGWLDRALVFTADGDLEQAQRLVDAVIAHDPAHLELPQAQAALGEARVQRQREQTTLLAEARLDEQAGRIDRAAEKYLRLLQAQDPEPARQGLLRCAEEFARRAEQSAADFDFRRAEALLAQAHRWSPQSSAIVMAERRIAQSRRIRERLARQPSPEERARLPILIAEANAALEQGQLIDPPGLSAWDKLRVAAAIAPQAPSVVRLQADFRRRAQECFEKALTQNRLRQAQSCLEAGLTLDPAIGPAMATAKHRLAERWLAYAEERIAATDYEAATEALGFARHWQADLPSLSEVGARLLQAQGGRR
jgi:tetratricopeptide (TPR) repeat protein